MYTEAIAAAKMTMMHAAYKQGANRLVNSLKGWLIKDDPDAERAMLMNALDMMLQSEVLTLGDGTGPLEVNLIAVLKNLWCINPMTQ